MKDNNPLDTLLDTTGSLPTSGERASAFCSGVAKIYDNTAGNQQQVKANSLWLSQHADRCSIMIADGSSSSRPASAKGGGASGGGSGSGD